MKAATAGKARGSAIEQRNFTSLSARQQRVVEALSGTAGWIPREAIDRIAGASNGPHIIAELRRKLGFDGIEMERIDAVDRDGKPCKPGRYRLTVEGRAALVARGFAHG